MVREAAQAGENEGELAIAEQMEAEFATNPSKIRRARAFANSVRWQVMDQRKLIAAITRSGPGGHQFMLVPDYRVARRIGKMVYLPRNVFISSDPTVVSGVLTDMKDNFSSGDAYQFLAPYFGTQSVFVVDSELHRQAKRELIQTIKGRVEFDHDRIADVAAHIDSLLPAGNYRLLPLIQNISARIILTQFSPASVLKFATKLFARLSITLPK